MSQVVAGLILHTLHQSWRCIPKSSQRSTIPLYSEKHTSPVASFSPVIVACPRELSSLAGRPVQSSPSLSRLQLSLLSSCQCQPFTLAPSVRSFTNHRGSFASQAAIVCRKARLLPSQASHQVQVSGHCRPLLSQGELQRSRQGFATPSTAMDHLPQR